MLLVVGCAKVVVAIPFLVCRVGFVRWWNVEKDQYETAGCTVIVHESRTAGEAGTRSIERPIFVQLRIEGLTDDYSSTSADLLALLQALRRAPSCDSLSNDCFGR